jgi:uroporphyrinogen III methyltransferase/synthase
MTMKRETSRKAIACCGSAETAGRLAAGLRKAGLPARAFGLVTLGVRDNWHAGMNMDVYEWVVLTSPTAAKLTLAALGSIFTGRFACVGETTAELVKEAGFSVAAVPDKQNRQGLLAEMAKQSAGKRLLLPMGDATPNDLWDGLKKMGFYVDAPVIYMNRPDELVMQDFKRAVEGGDFDAAAFTSGSAFTYATYAPGLEKLRLYCMGPSTAEKVWEKQWKVAAVANHHSVGGLVRTIVEAERG